LPNHSESARRLGLGIAVACCAVALASGAARAQAFPPNGGDFPTITLTLPPEGAPGLEPLPVPPPHGFDKESIWNMEVVGFNDNQGRNSSDDGWVENQNGRYILYMTDGPGKALNPMTGVVENNGTSLIDVTNPRHPVFLHHIPAPSGGGSTHVAVCAGNLLPHGQKNHWYMLRHDGSTDQEVWDVTNPTAPTQIATIISGLTANHHQWWECDTGVAYVIAQNATDGWHETGSKQHVYIYDLSDPAMPVFIRQWGLVGQQPSANIATAQSCYNAPGPNCYEGVTNPPGGVHQQYSAGTKKNRVYIAYGVDSNGVDQIVDREKLLTGCTAPTASANCANSPTQADLLFPQISYITMQPNQGGHTLFPFSGVPIAQEQENFLDGGPQKWDLMVNLSEDTTNDCFGQPWKNPSIIDITDERAPWPLSTPNVGQFPGDFCAKGARFGTHEINRRIFAPYYGKLLIVAYFNAGLQLFDIRDPLNPRRVGYFIQAPNANTQVSCGTFQGNTNYCRAATFSDLGEVDDRGYIYNLDRSGSGMTILRPTGDALDVVTGNNDHDGGDDDQH
jgi:hypothetical protein